MSWTREHAMDDQGVRYRGRQITNGDVVRVHVTEWEMHQRALARRERMATAIWYAAIVAGLVFAVMVGC